MFGLPFEQIAARMILALLAGLIIGFEREHNNRPAGMKTHILVCMGASLISILQLEIANRSIALVLENEVLASVVKSDVGRLGAQVISGIGFLGAGTIMHNHGSVRGLTTAATLWISACLGLTIGMGFYKISLMCIFLIMVVLVVLRFAQKSHEKRKYIKELLISFTNKKETMAWLNDYFIVQGISIKCIDLTDQIDNVYHCMYRFCLPRSIHLDTIISEISLADNIKKVSEEIKE